MSHIDCVTLRGQATPQGLGQLALIFHNQQPHQAILPAPGPAILKLTSACGGRPVGCCAQR
ncbi:hypothetical protein GCM10010435_52080 [Winogradskya consettensis]